MPRLSEISCVEFSHICSFVMKGPKLGISVNLPWEKGGLQKYHRRTGFFPIDKNEWNFLNISVL